MRWDPTDAAQVRRARKLAGHTQHQLAVMLHEEFGLAVTPSQGTVSKWIRNRQTPRLSAQRALTEYAAKYGPRREAGPRAQSTEDLASDTEPDSSYVTRPPSDPATSSDRSQDANSHEWSTHVADLSGEPLLGPRQGEFVDALVDRIHYGPSFNDDDYRVTLMTARILGLNRTSE